VLIYVVDTGKLPWADFTRRAIKDYAEKYHYDVMFTNAGAHPDRHPSWQKMRVFEYVQADGVLLMDLDIIPLPWAPPILGDLNPAEVNIGLNMRWEEEKQDPQDRLAREARRGVPPGTMVYNMGLSYWPRKYANVMRDLWSRGETVHLWWEQSEVNLWVRDSQVHVETIDRRYNAIPSQEVEQPPSDWRDKWFIHLAGMNTEQRTKFCQNLARNFKIGQ
jgi:hypothetical protein